jgi:hypothetical protein
MMKEPVDHILRPKLPWRTDDAAITECGYDASKVKTLSREDYFARKKELGAQRCALLTCMTCSDTATRWPTWEEDPRKAFEREIIWECGYYRSVDHSHGNRLLDELLAIAALIADHGDQFTAHIEATIQRRDWLAQKQALTKKPKVSRNEATWRPL